MYDLGGVVGLVLTLAVINIGFAGFKGLTVGISTLLGRNSVAFKRKTKLVLATNQLVSQMTYDDDIKNTLASILQKSTSSKAHKGSQQFIEDSRLLEKFPEKYWTLASVIKTRETALKNLTIYSTSLRSTYLMGALYSYTILIAFVFLKEFYSESGNVQVPVVFFSVTASLFNLFVYIRALIPRYEVESLPVRFTLTTYCLILVITILIGFAEWKEPFDDLNSSRRLLMTVILVSASIPNFLTIFDVLLRRFTLWVQMMWVRKENNEMCEILSRFNPSIQDYVKIDTKTKEDVQLIESKPGTKEVNLTFPWEDKHFRFLSITLLVSCAILCYVLFHNELYGIGISIIFINVVSITCYKLFKDRVKNQTKALYDRCHKNNHQEWRKIGIQNWDGYLNYLGVNKDDVIDFYRLNNDV